MGSAGKFLSFIRFGGSIFVFAWFILLFSVKPAHAYLDPGTSSMILQLLLGGVAGALVVGRLYLEKIKSLIAGLFGRQPPVQSREDEN